MITPKCGMMVRGKDSAPHAIRGCRGKIIAYAFDFNYDLPTILVKLEQHNWWLGNDRCWCLPSDLEAVELTPEEQDQQRRQEHANKYL